MKALGLFVQLLTLTAASAAAYLTWRNRMSLENLEREVGEMESAVDSAVAAFQGIAQELRAALASGNQQKQQELADRLDAKAQSLAQAVVRGTPAEDEQNG